MTFEPPTCPDVAPAYFVGDNTIRPETVPIRFHSCKRCGSQTSMFWWPCSFGEREFWFCDDCMLKFVRFIREGQE